MGFPLGHSEAPGRGCDRQAVAVHESEKEAFLAAERYGRAQGMKEAVGEFGLVPADGPDFMAARQYSMELGYQLVQDVPAVRAFDSGCGNSPKTIFREAAHHQYGGGF